MHRRLTGVRPTKQHGVVLVVALVLLVAVTLLSLAALSTTSLELLMASNQQARVNAFQQAEARVDGVNANLENFRVTGLVGAGRCTADFLNTSKYYDASSEVSCDSSDVVVPGGLSLIYSRVAVERLAPRLQAAPRFIETSAEKLKVATFKIDSRYDARDIRGGRAEHNQGVIVSVLTPSEETVVTGGDIDVN